MGGLLARARQGEDSPARLLIHANGERMAVSPLRRADGTLLGSAVLRFNGPKPLEMLWISLVSLLPAAGLVTIIAALVGSLFGAIVARGLVRRLKTATSATAAWGKGDFSRRIEDRSSDEIGQLAQDLNGMADRLQELFRARQELAAFEERNRLARELHDSAKQQVFATTMNLAAVKALWERNPAEARSRLDIATELSRQSQQELTSLIATLRPAQLEGQSLAQALADMTRLWERQHDISVHFQTENDPTDLPVNVAQAFYRVTQEALSNVARHANATQVEILLTERENAALLEIKDNGHGFDLSGPVRGLGLRSMQERVQSLGGGLEIHSDASGTCLSARVPLKKVSAYDG